MGTRRSADTLSTNRALRTRRARETSVSLSTGCATLTRWACKTGRAPRPRTSGHTLGACRTGPARRAARASRPCDSGEAALPWQTAWERNPPLAALAPAAPSLDVTPGLVTPASLDAQHPRNTRALGLVEPPAGARQGSNEGAENDRSRDQALGVPQRQH